ncbi:hypothetical protein [Variovorax sp. EBFNA2]|uniref:hypothetical protein n=1 Tax=Variovorax sp. EBFNA2 TaxID=3342097 RepID=UPI0029BFCA02|nr:hypothetical protein [Variovorax boronicumulans]WPG40506.1 hypothetical protein RZE79_14530 [Variovorax boronicumulans]
MTLIQANFLVVCFSVGAVGALLGLWAFSHRLGRQLDAQRRALDSEREQTRQTICAELALLGQQQTAHQEAQRLALAHWQSEQDARRRAEWQGLWPAPPSLPARRAGLIAPPVAPFPAQRTRSSPPTPALHEDSEPQKSPVPLVLPPVSHWEAETETAPERELTDEEIDALPPDLPVATRVPGRKLPAPKGPVLRNL